MNRLLFPFYRLSLRLMERIPGNGWKEKKRAAENRMRMLYPGKKIRGEEYYAGRLAVVLAVLFWGLGMVCFVELVANREESRTEEVRLPRPSYGQGDRETELEALIEGESEGTRIPIQIGERAYLPEEVQRIFAGITEGLEQEILGENESLGEVRSDLELPTSAREGAVSVEWVLSPSDVLDDSGRIQREVKEEGEVVELKALLRYREQEAEYTCYAHVYPPVRTEREALEQKLREELAAADENGKYESELILPEEIDGKRVSWQEADAHTGLTLALLVIVGAAAVWMAQAKKLEQQERDRKRQMILDYPELLLKIAMLLGAGMTLKGTFLKITAEYRKRKEKQPRYAYEEMLTACREMENGMGEAAAYESFGKRCGESGYVKLGSILSQNLKKGANGLQELLEQEAAAGFEARKQAARKLGEEAGTKLLLPMMLMLAIVLVILVIPAAVSF